MILIAYDGSSHPVCNRPSRRAVRWRADDRADGVEPFIDVMARTGAALGLAPGIVDFEEIDRA